MTNSSSETVVKDPVEQAVDNTVAFDTPPAHAASSVDETVGNTDDVPKAAASTPKSNVARNSTVMALGSIASRATGFLRTAVIGAALSGAVVADSYQVASTLPTMLYELLLGGVLASVIVPLLVKARKEPDGGSAYTQRLLTLAAILLAAATMLALLAVPLFTELIVSNGSAGEKRLVTLLSYLLLPEIFFYGMAAMLSAVLNARGHFAAPMWTPIMNNLVVITTGVLFMFTSGPAIPTPSTITANQLLILGVGTTLGVALQASALWPALRRVNFVWRWRFDFSKARPGEIGRISAWMLFYVVVTQVGVFVQMSLAFRAGQAGGPGTFIYNNAYLIFMMAHGIVAVSVITALLPQMSAAAVDKRYGEVTNALSLGIRLSSVVLIPATALYMALGVPIAILAFQWGAFTPEQAQSTGLGITIAAIGLVPFAIGQLQIFAFYAMRDTKTPALLNIPVVAARIGVNFAAFYFLPPEHIVAGLLMGNTVSYMVSAILSSYLLRRRLGPLGMNQILQTLTRLSLAALVAGFIGWGLAFGMHEVLGDSKLDALLIFIVGTGALGMAFVAGAVFLRVSEVSQLWSRINGIVQRRAKV